MRIAFVAPKINLETGGGSHWSLYLICRGLKELGEKVEVYSLLPPLPASAGDFWAAGVTLTNLGGGGSPRDLETLANVNADAVVVYGNLPIAYQLKSRVPGLPVIAYFNALSGFCTNLVRQQAGCWLTCSHLDRLRHHAGGFSKKLVYAIRGPSQVAAFRRGFRLLDGCLFDSLPLREAYRGVYDLPDERCRVVPECVDIEAITASAQSVPAHGEGLNLLYVGSLAHYKGMRLLVEALRRVSARWRLWVFGDGPDRPSVLAFRDEFPDRVIYRGHVDNRTLFRELAERRFVFVHPCLWFEAFGRAVIEVMTLGIPAIVPDVGGPAWIVANGVSGLHYRHRDAVDLARKIDWAAEHSGELAGMAAHGQAAARQYDYRRVTRLWLENIETMARGDRPHA